MTRDTNSNKVGNRPMAETAVRLGISGLLGLAASYVLYEAIFRVLPDSEFRPTIAWLSSYSIGIAVQHTLHRWLVFGPAASYWQSLRRTYVVYVVSLLGAAGLNLILVNTTSLHHRVIWLITVALVSLMNFFALKAYAFKE